MTSKVLEIGANWPKGVSTPLAMAPRMSAKAKARLDQIEKLDTAALLAACQFPVGAVAAYHDEQGEHDPCYVVLPGGLMMPMNFNCDPLTDVARAVFIVRAINATLQPADPEHINELTEAKKVRDELGIKGGTIADALRVQAVAIAWKDSQLAAGELLMTPTAGDATDFGVMSAALVFCFLAAMTRTAA